MPDKKSAPYPCFSSPKEPFKAHFPCDPVLNALAEDVGGRDLTSEFFLPSTLRAIGRIIAKETAILSGIGVARAAFMALDETLQVRELAREGARVHAGEAVLEISGCARSLLIAERVALNLLQRLSGVATLTRKFVEAVQGTGARIVDTRKTTPGLRALEKQAVLHGGGLNHRGGLYDAVMIKDNHIAALGGVASLASSIVAFRQSHPDVMIEVEADTPEQAMELFRVSGVDVVLLDNMTPAVLAEIVSYRPQGLWLEASGGVTLQTVGQIAKSGVDFISVGALTHSFRSIDFSFELSVDRTF